MDFDKEMESLKMTEFNNNFFTRNWWNYIVDRLKKIIKNNSGVQIKTIKKSITATELNNSAGSSAGTPIVLIPAPGVGKYIQVINGSFKYNVGTTSYIGSVLRFFFYRYLDPINWSTNDVRDPINLDQIFGNSPFADGGSISWFNFYRAVGGSQSSQAIRENTPLYCGFNGDLTQNGDGTIDIYLQYIEVSI